MENSGTVEVLQRYGHALCFLEVFEWWYYSGTPEVRMRYALKYITSGVYHKCYVYLKCIEYMCIHDVSFKQVYICVENQFS